MTPDQGPIGPGDDDVPAAEPTPEQYAERARRANRATRGALAALLTFEAIVVLLVPRTIRFTTGLGATRTVIVLVIAVLLIAGAGCVRRPWGIGLGSALQLVFLSTGFLIGTMFLIGAIFIAIWLRVLLLRHEIVGTAGGVRMLVQ